MLTGKALGAAIDKAIQLKIESGAISSKADVAAHFRIRTPSIYDWIKKGSISKDKLPELWRYFSDVVDSTHWGLPDFPCPIGDAVHSPTVTPKGNIVTPPRPIIAVDDYTPLSDEDVEVPRLTLKLSAGSGRLQWEIDEKGTPNRFRKSWCRKRRISPETLVSIVIEGDSMAPGIPDGASVVINTAKTDVRSGKRHAIDYLGEFFIKRLFKQPDGSIIVRSDNPDKAIYPDWVITPEHGQTLRILGRPEAISTDADD